MFHYPELAKLKKLYPEIGVKVLPQDRSTNTVKAYETVKGKVLPFVTFVGTDIEDVETKIFQIFHWEKNHRKIPCPVKMAVKEKVVTNAVKLEGETETDSPSKFGAIWMVNNNTGDRRKAQPCDVQAYLDKGYTAGKSFAPYVSQEKIEAAAELRRQELIAKGVNLGAGKGTGTFVINPSTKQIRRVDDVTVTKLLSEGWQLGKKVK